MTAGCISAGWCTAGRINVMVREDERIGKEDSKAYLANHPIRSCRRCKAKLSADEIAMTKKLVNRGTTVYYCTDCLAEMFDVKRKDIEEKIVYYKRMGCTLFQ